MDTTRKTAGMKTKTTWRQTVEELKNLKMTWGGAENQAKNRAEGRDLVATLWSEENK